MLKAGGVFIILDPAYPAERLISYLRIAQPKGWIQLQGAGEPAGEILSYLETAGIHCRWILPQRKEEIAEQLRDALPTQPLVAVGADDPAYIAFTSGSTGEPKGVLSRHGPITHFMPWQKESFALTENDRFALLSGLAYNHLHRDVFTPLALGAALYVPPTEIAREPQALCEWLRANAITVLHLTPALGQLLLTAGVAALPSVRRIFFGGDVLTQGDVARIRALAPNATIGCFYGATETQRAVGYYEIPADFATNDTDGNRPMPLGRGIEDVQLLILNKNGALAGIGELGDLFVRSPHLAEGYVDDDARTAEVFITNPFTDDPEDRLYKTGELARYSAGRQRRMGRPQRPARQHPRFSCRAGRNRSGAEAAPSGQGRSGSCARPFHLPNPRTTRQPETARERFGALKSVILIAYVVADEDESQSLRRPIAQLSQLPSSRLHGAGPFHNLATVAVEPQWESGLRRAPAGGNDPRQASSCIFSTTNRS